MKKLFGTDGIRGVAGVAPLDQNTVYVIGLALAVTLKARTEAPRVLLGMDTRESSTWIAGALTGGLTAGGATVENAGVITTPAIAHLTHVHGFATGVVISASHNPWEDNGIKLFGPDGYKLPDETELAIEAEIFRQLAAHTSAAVHVDAPPVDDADRAEYMRFLLASVPGLSLDNQKIVIDCANGAASAVAPQLFADLGGTVIVTHASPTGRNINQGCGALHADVVAAEVVKHQASLGITFDGDADRALFADEHGRVVNGDAVLLLAARDLHAAGQLNQATVVATTMSNMGLEAALGRSGIAMLRARPSGISTSSNRCSRPVPRSAANSPDTSSSKAVPPPETGLLTALLVLDVIHRTGKSLAELTADLKNFPQVIVNVRVREKRHLDSIPAVVSAIAEAETALAGTGRVVIRYSGTEALARVMIEAEDHAQMTLHAEAIAGAIRAELGV